MAFADAYFSVHKLPAMTDPDWADFLTWGETLGANPNAANPRQRNHWVTSISGDDRIYEAYFVTGNIAPIALRIELASILGVPPAFVSTSTNESGEYGYIETYSYDGDDYFEVQRFGYDGDYAAYAVSQQNAQAYKLATNAIWNG